MKRFHPIRRMRRSLTAPLRARFDAIDRRLEELASSLDGGITTARATALARVDVSRHNEGATPPSFDRVVSQVVSAAQFSHPDFERLRRVMYPSTVTLQWGASDAEIGVLHRKLWEFVYVLRAAEQFGILQHGRRALGFGVGREPIPATLAHYGLSVLATDLDTRAEESAVWAESGQHMEGLDALSQPEIVSDEILGCQVSTRYVDMTDIPADLGTFDLIWSCCALEHLGSPEAGLGFVQRTLDLLKPGGVSVHTTEFELTPHEQTADYGHLAVYRKDDLDAFAATVRKLGFEMDTSWFVSLESPADRWIALPPYPHNDPAHLKLVIGDSVSTSVGLLVRRPQ